MAQRGDVDGDEFTARERLAVRYSERMHEHMNTVSDELLGELRSEYDDGEFVELGFTVAQFISMGQFVALLGIPNPDLVPPALD